MIDFLYYTIILIIATFLIGYYYSFINKKNSKYLQRLFGWNVFCIFSSVGTIIHELSHFIMCLLFLHNVTEVELFRPVKGKEDGILGFVKHAYKGTIYRKAGNFFIGCAPILSGSLIIMALLNVLKYTKISVAYILILLIISSIAVNMDMSKADIKNSLFGCISLLILV